MHSKVFIGLKILAFFRLFVLLLPLFRSFQSSVSVPPSLSPHLAHAHLAHSRSMLRPRRAYSLIQPYFHTNLRCNLICCASGSTSKGSDSNGLDYAQVRATVFSNKVTVATCIFFYSDFSSYKKFKQTRQLKIAIDVMTALNQWGEKSSRCRLNGLKYKNMKSMRIDFAAAVLPQHMSST